MKWIGIALAGLTLLVWAITANQDFLIMSMTALILANIKE